jgi:glycosyltransferase involved in cell wall biosynthesis
MKPGIVLIGNYPPPFGGVPTHVKYLAEHLAGRGWDVHVLSLNNRNFGVERVAESITVHRPGWRERLLALASRESKVTGFAAWRDLYPTLRKYKGAESLVMYLKRVTLEHNVKVISAYHVFGAATLGAFITEDLGVPLITTIFGEIYSGTHTFFERRRELEHVAKHTSRWLSCSHHCARSMKLLGLPIDVETLHYGIDTFHFRPDRDGSSIRRRFGMAPDDPVILFVGRMKTEMGLGVLMQAIPLVLKERADARFLIVGSRGDLTEPARNMSRRLPHSVFVAKDLPYDELPDAYAAATIAVAPSINARACLGLAIAEALATGRPVVGCEVGGTREVLIDGDVGKVVAAHDPFALAGAIVDLLADPRARDAMGRRGREHAVTKFEKDLTNERMEAIIGEVLGRSESC